MQAVAERVARDDLVNSGVGCVDTTIDVVVDESGSLHSVTVVVDCVVNHGDLELLGLRERHVFARSTEVIDRWRVD